jgi:hypothetical protein
MLQQANNEIKTLNFKLSRLVSSGNVHQPLYMGQETYLDVIPDQITYCKVSIKGQKDQLVFKVQ